ncbi:HAD family hydrolase [Hugenholtzia roseola]|uniref:HAD family hydrolase n=1 Tax=Hugenholtzia roseola TaxID=1002 RepID=UPI000409B4A1|nr:HAD family phosphatase [Hugenholtzia roseola]
MTSFPSLDRLEVIIFDLGGVLLDLDYKATNRAFEQLLHLDFDYFYTQTKQTTLFDAFEIGAISPQTFREHIRQMAQTQAIQKEPITDERIDDAWNAMLQTFPVQRIELLKEISKKKKIYLLSNTNAIHKARFDKIFQAQYGSLYPNLDHFFVQAHYSHLLGKRKPEVATFQHLIDLHQLDPAKTLFIDDSPQHIAGAQQAGLQAFWLQVQKGDDILNYF